MDMIGCLGLQSAQKLQQGSGLSTDATFVADIANGSSSSLDQALQGADALVIATSAVPKLKGERKEGQPPELYFEQMPEQVRTGA